MSWVILWMLIWVNLVLDTPGQMHKKVQFTWILLKQKIWTFWFLLDKLWIVENLILDILLWWIQVFVLAEIPSSSSSSSFCLKKKRGHNSFSKIAYFFGTHFMKSTIFVCPKDRRQIMQLKQHFSYTLSLPLQQLFSLYFWLFFKHVGLILFSIILNFVAQYYSAAIWPES